MYPSIHTCSSPSSNTTLPCATPCIPHRLCPHLSQRTAKLVTSGFSPFPHPPKSVDRASNPQSSFQHLLPFLPPASPHTWVGRNGISATRQASLTTGGQSCICMHIRSPQGSTVVRPHPHLKPRKRIPNTNKQTSKQCQS
ncbi:hypothetical protein BCR34DRAFT_73437 [Clohesyomyces aquaticus]|uniref:Uncharacterized protein n=1 Tax=Clohesyomyces aquaticus TaxID=1231657 RepID=A0A1Y1YZE0_9PLEO|nr:hypothetical protein BCR34DRAFT_73437 [Clohesyomyces aquaticus]